MVDKRPSTVPDVDALTSGISSASSAHLLSGTVFGEYLILEYGGIVGVLAGSVAILGSLVMTGFEAFIQLLQAYVFTLLAALYIGGALADEH